MTTLTLETEPIANQVTISDEKLIVDLADGRSLSIPLDWYPRLIHTLHLKNGKTGRYWVMATQLSGQILMSILELRGCWQVDGVVKASDRLSVG